MLLEEKHSNIHGIVHGGMIFTFLHQTLGHTVWEAADRGECAFHLRRQTGGFSGGGRRGDARDASHRVCVRAPAGGS